MHKKVIDDNHSELVLHDYIVLLRLRAITNKIYPQYTFDFMLLILCKKCTVEPFFLYISKILKGQNETKKLIIMSLQKLVLVLVNGLNFHMQRNFNFKM